LGWLQRSAESAASNGIMPERLKTPRPFAYLTRNRAILTKVTASGMGCASHPAHFPNRRQSAVKPVSDSALTNSVHSHSFQEPFRLAAHLGSRAGCGTTKARSQGDGYPVVSCASETWRSVLPNMKRGMPCFWNLILGEFVVVLGSKWA